jgi:hypothetical protein
VRVEAGRHEARGGDAEQVREVFDGDAGLVESRFKGAARQGLGVTEVIGVAPLERNVGKIVFGRLHEAACFDPGALEDILAPGGGGAGKPRSAVLLDRLLRVLFFRNRGSNREDAGCHDFSPARLKRKKGSRRTVR